VLVSCYNESVVRMLACHARLGEESLRDVLRPALGTLLGETLGPALGESLIDALGDSLEMILRLELGLTL
jgi:hypothetical protein